MGTAFCPSDLFIYDALSSKFWDLYIRQKQSYYWPRGDCIVDIINITRIPTLCKNACFVENSTNYPLNMHII